MMTGQMPPTEPPKFVFTEEHFINRELSWLAFNSRVLDEAARADLPVLERVKFIAITASNLDEFFMVRVGGLQAMREQGKRVKDNAGLSPTQLWEQIQQQAGAFVARQYEILNGQLLPMLREKGIRRLTASELNTGQRTHLHDYFVEHIAPVLSPVALDAEQPRANIPALHIVIICTVQNGENGHTEKRKVIFVLPQAPTLPRHIPVPDPDGGEHLYMNVEDVVSLFIGDFFPSEKVTATARFRVSRNTDITLDDEGAFDLASEMEAILEKRQSGAAIRIEIEAGAPRNLVKVIRELCGSKGPQIYEVNGELDLRGYYAISSLAGFEELKVVPWESQPCTAIQPGESIFDAIKRGDILMQHPYESFDPILSLVEEAAEDPDVIAIKQILYRTAKNSRIISALIRAAQAGKHVTVLVELKARFDEARNLERAGDLINAGAQIIYGVAGLKTHAKVCLVMRRESGRLMRSMHFGTGNYNESTAKLYTDISVLTCRAEFGSDASAFFNTVTGRSRFVHFEKISMAPFGLRERLVSLIRSEGERARQGETAEIMLKMNALEDREMIEALYEASHAGVKIRLNIRGICCLRPGVKGLSENISVVSIIDRYLELKQVRRSKLQLVGVSSLLVSHRTLPSTTS